MQCSSGCHRVYRMVMEGEVGCPMILLLDLFKEKVPDTVLQMQPGEQPHSLCVT